MSVKKTNKKKIIKPVTKTPTKKKKVKKEKVEMKESIHNAVDKIPGLIVEQIAWHELNPTEPTTEMIPIKPIILADKKTLPTFHKPEPFNKQDMHKMKLLWLFVFIIGIVIFGMWAWNAIVYFQDTNNASQKQAGLIQQTKDSFNTILQKNIASNDFTKELDKQEIKDKLQAQIADETDKEKVKASLASVLNLISALNNVTTTTTTSSTIATTTITAATATITTTTKLK